jgi:predicted HTH domain antitoxin
MQDSLEAYKSGKITLWEAAQNCNLTLWEIIKEIKKARIYSNYDLNDLKKDLKALQQR